MHRGAFNMFSKMAEKGQALILIAFAAIGLFAFTALAIDGSAVFSDHRHAQNAADTAAFAAALAKVRDTNPALGHWKTPGILRAETNGYKNDGVNEVKVYSCDEWTNSPDNPSRPARCQGLPADTSKDAEYVMVRIKSVVKLTFARVIGWSEMTNYANAVVHADPPTSEKWFGGRAMVAANRTCPAHGDFGPMDFGGNGTTIVNNSGIFVNSSCSLALDDHGGGNSNSITTTTGVCVIGGIDPHANGFTPTPAAGTTNCGNQVNIYDYWMPDTPLTPGGPSLLDPYCSHSGSITGSGGDYRATPGAFSGRPFPDVRGGHGTVKLEKGIYCIYDGFDLNAGWNMTTDLDGDNVQDQDDEGVLFYIVGGNFALNGGGVVRLDAMVNTTTGFPDMLLHYLIYIPKSNPAGDVDISGNSDTTLTGMIMAPNSNVDLIGSSGTFSLSAQIISNNMRVSGDGAINITYNPDVLPPALKFANLAPTQ